MDAINALGPRRSQEFPTGKSAVIKGVGTLLREFFPICRSLSGEGNLETLSLIKKILPVQLHEYSSGTRVFDWTIPPQWEIREAWIENVAGERLIDFSHSNLHIFNYSAPVNETMDLDTLNQILYFLRDQPEAIPYRTTYY